MKIVRHTGFFIVVAGLVVLSVVESSAGCLQENGNYMNSDGRVIELQNTCNFPISCVYELNFPQWPDGLSQRSSFRTTFMPNLVSTKYVPATAPGEYNIHDCRKGG
jgi:hypothetical protein